MTAEGRALVVQAYVAEPSVRNRNALVCAHQYLCRRGARKFFRGTVEHADLEQVAAIGLIKASQRYSDRYQTPFEAYAWLMIVGELMHFVRDHERPVRIPRALRGLEGRFNSAFERLCSVGEGEPGVVELARELGISPALADELRALRTRPAPAGHAGGRTAGVEEVEIAAPPVFERFDLEDRLALFDALRKLSRRELAIVRAIFFHERTQAEVGCDLGISQRQVSRLLARVIQRLGVALSA